jgi:hypothetical protein
LGFHELSGCCVNLIQDDTSGAEKNQKTWRRRALDKNSTTKNRRETQAAPLRTSSLGFVGFFRTKAIADF